MWQLTGTYIKKEELIRDLHGEYLQRGQEFGWG